MRIENEQVIGIMRIPGSFQGADDFIALCMFSVTWNIRIVPVLNLTDTVRLPQANLAESARILIVKGNESVPYIGLLVSAVSNIVSIDTKAFLPTEAHYFNGFCFSKAVCTFGYRHQEFVLMDLKQIAQEFENHSACTIEYAI